MGGRKTRRPLFFLDAVDGLGLRQPAKVADVSLRFPRVAEVTIFDFQI